MKRYWSHELLPVFFLASTMGIVLYTLYAAFHYSSNAILGRDEANFIILSSQKILAANNFGEFIRGFLPSHGQHTLLGMQLVNMATYFSFGALDRRIMNVIGVVILCLAALLLPWRRSRSRTEIILLCATLFPLILSPAHNACIVNASCTGNHYFGIAASVIALFFFTKAPEKKRFFIGAEFFMLLAIFSLPAALALVPISVFVLARAGAINRSRIIAAHLAFIVFIVVLHSCLTYPNTIFSFMHTADAAGEKHSINDIVMFLATFFIIAGSLFYWLAEAGNTWMLVIIGATIVMLTAVIILKTGKFTRDDVRSFPFYGTLLFSGMILIISFGRYYSFGSSRYSVYTAFLCAMLFMAFFSRINQSGDAVQTSQRIKILFCSSALSLLYFFTALHYHQQYLLDLEQKVGICKKMWYTEGYACGVMITHEEATQIIKSAINDGIYRIEK